MRPVAEEVKGCAGGRCASRKQRHESFISPALSSRRSLAEPILPAEITWFRPKPLTVPFGRFVMMYLEPPCMGYTWSMLSAGRERSRDGRDKHGHHERGGRIDRQK
jgi:hypothetical protein